MDKHLIDKYTFEHGQTYTGKNERPSYEQPLADALSQAIQQIAKQQDEIERLRKIINDAAIKNPQYDEYVL